MRHENESEAVERLPREQRDVFGLGWYGGLEQKEISELLHVSIPTVKRRLRAARIFLFETLQGESPLDNEE